MASGGDHRLAAVTLDPGSLSAASADDEHERRVAIFDLVEQNSFRPAGADHGPFTLRLALEDDRLVFDVQGPDYLRRHMLSLTPLKTVIRDYQMICGSYQEALRRSTPGQIEAVDMGRRGLHDEGARLLAGRLAGKIEIDHDTGRRLFTLICALNRR